jgi:lactoylglutathione lyase
MKLTYTILYVPDVAATVAFYEKAFGLKPLFVHEAGDYAELDTGAVKLAFADENFVSTCHEFRRLRPDESPAGAEVGFVTEDVEVAYARALAAGAVAYVAPHAKPWGQVVSYVRDLNGFVVELCTEVAPPS